MKSPSTLAQILLLLTIARRIVGYKYAEYMAHKLWRESKVVDSDKYIRNELKRRNIDKEVVILSRPSHITERFGKYLKMLHGASSGVQNKLLNLLHRAMSGQAVVVVVRVSKHDKIPVIIVPPKHNPVVLSHEVGHIIDFLGTDGEHFSDLTVTKRRISTALNYLSKSYRKRSRYGVENMERRAWDIAGIPKNNKLRKAALGTYANSYGMITSLLHYIALAAAMPHIKSAVNDLYGKIKRKRGKL